MAKSMQVLPFPLPEHREDDDVAAGGRRSSPERRHAVVALALLVACGLMDSELRSPGWLAAPGASRRVAAPPRRLAEFSLQPWTIGILAFLAAYALTMCLSFPIYRAYKRRLDSDLSRKVEDARREKAHAALSAKIKEAEAAAAAAAAADAAAKAAELPAEIVVQGLEDEDAADTLEAILLEAEGDESVATQRQWKRTSVESKRGWERSPTSSSASPRWEREAKKGKGRSSKGSSHSFPKKRASEEEVQNHDQSFELALAQFDIALEAIKAGVGVEERKPRKWNIERKAGSGQGRAEDERCPGTEDGKDELDSVHTCQSLPKVAAVDSTGTRSEPAAKSAAKKKASKASKASAESKASGTSKGSGLSSGSKPKKRAKASKAGKSKESSRLPLLESLPSVADDDGADDAGADADADTSP